MLKEIVKNPFVVSDKSIKNDNLITSDTITLSNAFLYYRKTDDITVKKFKNIKMILIGYAMNTRNSDLNQEEILEDLIGLYIQGYNLFLDEIDLLNGRFVIIVDSNKDTEIYNDATALRPIFQWNKSVFASHESVLKAAVREYGNIELNNFGINNGYLDATNTVDVYKFNPNLTFSFKDKSFTRIYPRTKYEVMDRQNILEKVITNLEEQVKWLEKSNKKLYFSLTGGYDSRVSLSLIKPILNNITFFTYMTDFKNTKSTAKKEIYLKDNEIVKKLADNININHQIYGLENYYPNDEFKDLIRTNTSSNHSVNVSYLMYKELKENSLHIKSTLYEIGKMPYPPEMDFTNDYHRLFKLSVKWQTVNFKRKVKDKKAYFNSFIERSKFKEIEKYNYNLPMMLFWESRMANWHGNITQETDHTSETFIFLNSRYILDLLLRAEFDIRNNKEIFTDIVEIKWPILQYFIPNSYRTLKDEVISSNTFKLTNLQLELSSIKNINTVINNNEIQIMPTETSYLHDDDLTVNFINKSVYDKKVVLKGYYRHPQKNIFIKINDIEYSINDFYEGMEFKLSGDSNMTLKYRYTKNFDNQSWYDAGKLLLTFSN